MTIFQTVLHQVNERLERGFTQEEKAQFTAFLLRAGRNPDRRGGGSMIKKLAPYTKGLPPADAVCHRLLRRRGSAGADAAPGDERHRGYRHANGDRGYILMAG